MQQLGNTDPAFTLRVYSHLMRRSDQERDGLKALVEGQSLQGKGREREFPAVGPSKTASDQQKSPALAGLLIGAPGFEPGTSPTRTVRATRLRHAPRKASIPQQRRISGPGPSTPAASIT